MTAQEFKKIYIADLTENSQVETLFLVKEKNNGITKTGKPYIALNLTDKTGEIKGRIWDNAEKLNLKFSQGDIVAVKAFSVMYQNTLQLNIHWIEKNAADEKTLMEFLPASKCNPDELFAKLQEFIDKISNPFLKQLLTLIFEMPDIQTAFKTAPAAKSVHHDYLGGLIEHTYNVTRLACVVADYYPGLNLDLLLAGAMLHDIGKIYEIAYVKNFTYTDQGRLIGHITLADELVTGIINKIPDFPSDLSLVFRHILLSHHGQYEFGSPKRPKTPEALLLSYIDDLDAKMYGFIEFIKKEKNSDSKWTSYHKLFDRYLFTDTIPDEPKSKNNDVTT